MARTTVKYSDSFGHAMIFVLLPFLNLSLESLIESQSNNYLRKKPSFIWGLIDFRCQIIDLRGILPDLQEMLASLKRD